MAFKSAGVVLAVGASLFFLVGFASAGGEDLFAPTEFWPAGKPLPPWAWWLKIEAKNLDGVTRTLPTFFSNEPDSVYDLELSVDVDRETASLPSLPESIQAPLFTSVAADTDFFVNESSFFVEGILGRSSADRVDATKCFAFTVSPPIRSGGRTTVNISVFYDSLCQFCGMARLWFLVHRVESGLKPELAFFEASIPCGADVLLVTNEDRIDLTDEATARYGGHQVRHDFRGWTYDYIALWDERGKSVRYVNLASGLARRVFGLSRASLHFELDGRPLEQETVESSRRYVSGVRKIVRKANPDYVVLFGGMSVVPMPFQQDAVLPDNTAFFTTRDGRLYSDDLYAMPQDGVAPNVIVSRIPTPFSTGKARVNLFAAAVANAIEGERTPLQRRKTFMVSDICGGFEENLSCWREEGSAFTEHLLPGWLGRQGQSIWSEFHEGNCNFSVVETPACLWSPLVCNTADYPELSSACATQDFQYLFTHASMLFLNLHGSEEGGLAAHGVVRTTEVKYVLFDDLRNSSQWFSLPLNPVFVSLACFGGRITSSQEFESFPLYALSKGARAVIGSSYTVFGGTNSQTGIKAFAKNLSEGSRLGQAFLALKKEAYAAMQAHRGNTEAFAAAVAQPTFTEHEIPGDPLHGIQSAVRYETPSPEKAFYNALGMVLYGDPYSRIRS